MEVEPIINLEGSKALDAKEIKKPILENEVSFGDFENINLNGQDTLSPHTDRDKLVLDENIAEQSKKRVQAKILEQEIIEREHETKGAAIETTAGGFLLMGLTKLGLIAAGKLLVSPFLIGRFFRMLDLSNENKIARGEEPKNTELIKYGKAAAMLSYFGYGMKALTPILIPLSLSLWQLYVLIGVVGGTMYGLYMLGRYLPTLSAVYRKIKRSKKTT